MNITAKTRKTRRVSPETQRAELLDAASEILAETGPDGLSMRKLSAALGTSTMVIYTAFGSREGLIAALYEEAFERMAQMQESVPQPGNPIAWLTGLGAAYRHFALTYPAYYALMISATMPLSTFVASAEEPVARGIARQRAYHSLVECVSACQEQGYFSDDQDTAEITAVLWATVHGHVSLELAGFHESRKEADARFALLSKSVVIGLLTPKGIKAWAKYTAA